MRVLWKRCPWTSRAANTRARSSAEPSPVSGAARSRNGTAGTWLELNEGNYQRLRTAIDRS